MENSFRENETFREDLKLEFLKLVYEYGYDKILSNQKSEEENKPQEEVEMGGMKKWDVLNVEHLWKIAVKFVSCVE